MGSSAGRIRCRVLRVRGASGIFAMADFADAFTGREDDVKVVLVMGGR